MPEVSILMPVYNAEKHLQACVESIQRQHFSDWQLLAIDDFSTDATPYMLNDLAEKDRRIKVGKNSVKGIIPALSKAFSFSTGRYITRMDADDLMPVNKLSDLLEAARQHPKTVATGLVNYFSEAPVSAGYLRYQDWLNSVLRSQSFQQNMYRECVVASPNWMVHRSCFENEIDLEKLSYPEDYDLVFQWYQKGFEVKGIDKLTHWWREHPARTSRNSETYQQESFFRLKTSYFIRLELKDGENVQLIGTGKKGKLVASILAENLRQFDWFDYQQEDAVADYRSVHELSDQYPTILTNWPLHEERQREITAFLESKKLYFGKNIWLF